MMHKWPIWRTADRCREQALQLRIETVYTRSRCSAGKSKHWLWQWRSINTKWKLLTCTSSFNDKSKIGFIKETYKTTSASSRSRDWSCSKLATHNHFHSEISWHPRDSRATYSPFLMPHDKLHERSGWSKAMWGWHVTNFENGRGLTVRGSLLGAERGAQDTHSQGIQRRSLPVSRTTRNCTLGVPISM